LEKKNMRLIKTTNVKNVFGISVLAAFLALSINTNSFAVSKKELRRISDGGSVEVVTVYLNPLGKSDDNQQSFELTLDTHSDDLSRYKLVELSTLKVEGGSEIKASEWQNSGGGGHHISGTITFDLPDVSTAKYIELLVKNVGGIEERVFRWDLPQK
jgi:hypothetical protein